jgi:cytochrome oxidase Cu insertion factor (SCO1/SenC/PrrC family)
LVAVLAAGYGSFVLWRSGREPAPVAVVTAPPAVGTTSSAAADGPVADFVLTDETGKPFDSASLKGKVWVTSFFFTNCPAICWRMNQALAAWQHTHPDSDVKFVSITCDPDNDTPEALAKYAAHFKADPNRWKFLTGEMPKIQDIGQKSFKISVVKGDHTDRACVVDKTGKVRGRFRLTEPDQAEMLARLLDVVESEPAPESAPSDEKQPQQQPAEPPAQAAEPSANDPAAESATATEPATEASHASAP